MLRTSSVLGLITARGGSKGLPGKNILQVGGRPLIQWTIDAARRSRYIDRLILSSDDPAIIEVAVRGGCEAPFRREAALAADESLSIDVAVDALQRVPGYDVLVLLQPTSPLRLASDIDGVLDLLECSGAPACVSVRAVHDHPYWAFRLDNAGRLEHFAEAPAGLPSRRQDLPPAWCLNGAVYAARTGWFLRERRFVSPQTVAYPMPAERSVDVDSFEDLEEVRAGLEMNESGAGRQ